MTQTEELAPPKRGRKSTFDNVDTVMFKLGGYQKQQFQRLCESRGETMSTALRRMVGNYVKRHRQ
jgi:hypothetical protein